MLDARIDVYTLVCLLVFIKIILGLMAVYPQTFTSINKIIVRSVYVSHESKTMMLHFNFILIKF